MAIQIPNPGTGNGATGDNEFVLWSKVKDNFSDQTNAASRLVGEGSGQLPTVGSIQSIAFGATVPRDGTTDLDTYGFGVRAITGGDANVMTGGSIQALTLRGYGETRIQLTLPYNEASKGVLGYRIRKHDAIWTPWYLIYSQSNTTLDSNGAIKPSSPVLRVFSDKLEGNADGDAMAATYTKNGVGDYTITGTTGLRTDGWYVVVPNDMNGNPKVAITLDDTDGVITLRSYVRIFDMSTFKFVPDLEQPLDIPDGRWIDLRFNDLPIEAQEELPTDGG